MGSLPDRIFKVAMLNADTPVPAVRPKYATYGAVFHALLSAAASRISPHVKFESTDFDVVNGEYPASPADFDALLVTGAAAGAYEHLPWIRPLEDYLVSTYRDFPQVRIFGSCFGHQIICQGLLRDFGCVVEQDPKGYELGVHPIQLTDSFRKAFNSAAVPPLLRLQFIHRDHVRVPVGGLPPPWTTMGYTKHCVVQGVCEPGRVLTYQGHFEFDRFINSETLKVFGAKWKPEEVEDALRLIDQDDDAPLAAELVVRFFLEDHA